MDIEDNLNFNGITIFFIVLFNGMSSIFLLLKSIDTGERIYFIASLICLTCMLLWGYIKQYYD